MHSAVGKMSPVYHDDTSCRGQPHSPILFLPRSLPLWSVMLFFTLVGDAATFLSACLIEKLPTTASGTYCAGVRLCDFHDPRVRLDGIHQLSFYADRHG